MKTLADIVTEILNANGTTFSRVVTSGVTVFSIDGTYYHIQVLEGSSKPLLFGIVKDGKLSLHEYSLEGLAQRIFKL